MVPKMRIRLKSCALREKARNYSAQVVEGGLRACAHCAQGQHIFQKGGVLKNYWTFRAERADAQSAQARSAQEFINIIHWKGRAL